nr:immunoglobulin heavy chain junction region [Macaca mulatta]
CTRVRFGDLLLEHWFVW